MINKHVVGGTHQINPERAEVADIQGRVAPFRDVKIPCPNGNTLVSNKNIALYSEISMRNNQ